MSVVKKKILEVYCVGSIPVDGASLYFYDLNNKGKGLTLDERNLEKGFTIEKKPTSLLNISCFADGAYPCYVAIDQFKNVKKIFFELNNTAGWGSSIFENKKNRISKLENELKAKQFTPADVQIDMVVPASVSVEFGYSHRATYTPWSHFNFLFEDKEFLKDNQNVKKKLCDLEIKSDFLVFDGYPDLKANEKKEIIKNKNTSKIDFRILFGVENKKYPVYYYNVNRSIDQKIKEISTTNDMGLSNPYFPILSIEDIEGCKLNKASDSKLEFHRIEKKLKILPSNNFLFQVNAINESKESELKICQLDLHDLNSLNILKHVKIKFPETLSLRHLKHIDNWSALFKFFGVKTIEFYNCELKPESNKKNGWWDCISRMVVNRKKNNLLNKKYGELSVIVNGEKLDFS